VLDSGPGIPEKERQKVFERFYRQLSLSEAGSGLGLSVEIKPEEACRRSDSFAAGHARGVPSLGAN